MKRGASSEQPQALHMQPRMQWLSRRHEPPRFRDLGVLRGKTHLLGSPALFYQGTAGLRVPYISAQAPSTEHT